MAKQIRFNVAESQYDRLAKLKEQRGYTWKGMMLEGAKHMEMEQNHLRMQDLPDQCSVCADDYSNGDVRHTLDGREMCGDCFEKVAKENIENFDMSETTGR
jgi:hypothetical protein